MTLFSWTRLQDTYVSWTRQRCQHANCDFSIVHCGCTALLTYVQTPRRKNKRCSLTSKSWVSKGTFDCGMGFIGKESHASPDAAEWIGCN